MNLVSTDTFDLESGVTTSTLVLENLQESDFTLYSCDAFWTNILHAVSAQITLARYGTVLMKLLFNQPTKAKYHLTILERKFFSKLGDFK